VTGRQKVGMLSKQLKIALEALDDIGWGDHAYESNDEAAACHEMTAKDALVKIRGGDGRPR
jgi:hypothetical protein